MIKGFGVFAFVFFLFLCSVIGGFGSGFGIWFLSILLVASGTLSYSLFVYPVVFESHGYAGLKRFSRFKSSGLVTSICDVAELVRKDGLFAADSIRKDIRDPWLQNSLKRMIEGYDQNAIVPAIRNEQIRMLEHWKTWTEYHSRIANSMAIFGLVGSLCHLMAELSKSGSNTISVSVSFVPFLISLLSQLLLQSWYQNRSDDWEEGIRTYYSVLEAGVSGIQSAMSAEVLKEQLESRIKHA